MPATGSQTVSLHSRLLVAAGGGGGAGERVSCGFAVGPAGGGGDAGASTGSAGQGSTPCVTGTGVSTGGGGGTQSQAGTGGTNQSNSTAGQAGTDGSLGDGGSNQAGGGGGGGYYGGGSGGDVAPTAGSSQQAATGGGGGSSYLPGGISSVSAGTAGSIRFSYQAPATVRIARLSVRLTAPSRAAGGTRFIVTAAGSDAGPSAAGGVTIAVRIPRYLSVISAPGSVTHRGRLVIWDEPVLAARSTSRFRVTLEVARHAQGVAALRAVIAATGSADPDPAAEIAKARVRLVSNPG